MHRIDGFHKSIMHRHRPLRITLSSKKTDRSRTRGAEAISYLTEIRTIEVQTNEVQTNEVQTVKILND